VARLDSVNGELSDFGVTSGHPVLFIQGKCVFRVYPLTVYNNIHICSVIEAL